MTETLFLLAHAIGCLLACWYALNGLNACTRKTAAGARISFGAIAIGSFAALLYPPAMDAHGIAAALIVLGVGIGFIANRRKCVCLNCPMRPGPRQPQRMEWSELNPADRRDKKCRGPAYPADGSPT